MGGVREVLPFRIPVEPDSRLDVDVEVVVRGLFPVTFIQSGMITARISSCMVMSRVLASAARTR